MPQTGIINKNLTVSLPLAHLSKKWTKVRLLELGLKESTLISRIKFFTSVASGKLVSGLKILKRAKQDWWLLVQSS